MYFKVGNLGGNPPHKNALIGGTATLLQNRFAV
jgi:hypothetical protein